MEWKERIGYERKRQDRKGNEGKGKERESKEPFLLVFPLSSFSIPCLPFLSFLEEQRRRKRRERNGKFPFLSKEKPPDRVPRRSFGNLKGGGPRGAPG